MTAKLDLAATAERLGTDREGVSRLQPADQCSARCLGSAAPKLAEFVPEYLLALVWQANVPLERASPWLAASNNEPVAGIFRKARSLHGQYTRRRRPHRRRRRV